MRKHVTLERFWHCQVSCFFTQEADGEEDLKMDSGLAWKKDQKDFRRPDRMQETRGLEIDDDDD